MEAWEWVVSLVVPCGGGGRVTSCEGEREAGGGREAEGEEEEKETDA